MQMEEGPLLGAQSPSAPPERTHRRVVRATALIGCAALMVFAARAASGAATDRASAAGYGSMRALDRRRDAQTTDDATVGGGNTRPPSWTPTAPPTHFPTPPHPTYMPTPATPYPTAPTPVPTPYPTAPTPVPTPSPSSAQPTAS